MPDTRSPACIPTIFEGDNDGATTPGVTATEIRVAFITGGAEHEAGVRALVDYVNRHFELYGRRIEPVFFPNPSNEPAAQRAFADAVAAEDIFAVLPKPVNSRWTASFFQGLARHGIIAVVDGVATAMYDHELLDPLHPYLWSVAPSIDQQQRNLASFVCVALAGHAPGHAPDLRQDRPRTFGVIAMGNYVAPKVREFTDGLATCDAPIAPTAEVLMNVGDGAAALRTAVQRLQATGVTTLYCACADNQAPTLARQLDAVGWAPELLAPLGTYGQLEENYVQTIWSARLRSRIFGLQPFPKVLPSQAQWWFSAVLETRPTAAFNEGYYLVSDYDQLLVLASGIQAAGPMLTPDTFGQGLMSSPFPNTEAGQPPRYEPAVGFGPGDHSFYNDFSVVWWSDDADGYGPTVAPNARGSWCYLDRGARFSVGSFPANADSRFFDPAEPCR